MELERTRELVEWVKLGIFDASLAVGKVVERPDRLHLLLLSHLVRKVFLTNPDWAKKASTKGELIIEGSNSSPMTWFRYLYADGERSRERV